MAATAACGSPDPMPDGGDARLEASSDVREAGADAQPDVVGPDVRPDVVSPDVRPDVPQDVGPDVVCTAPEVLCGDMCFNTQTDLTHCGSCTTVCAVPANATATCAAGACGFTCNAGFGDCDGNAANGCEVNLATDPANCGACAMACPAAANGTSTCAAMVCGVACTAGFGDCDANPTNGCEVNLATDPANCGACAMACPGGANATSTCAASTCGVTCAMGFGDCDSSAANGCEIDLRSDAANCGACATACGAGQMCTAASCTATCSLPVVRALTLPTDSVMGTLVGGTNRIPSTGCQANTGGNDQIFTLTVPTRTGVLLTTGGMLDTVVSIRRTCDAAMSEVACDDDQGAGTLSTLRAVLEPGSYFVILDQFSTAPTPGPFTLNLSTFTPAANSTCATATALTPGTALTGQDAGGGVSRSTACVTASNGGQLFYSLTVPANSRMAVRATPTSTPAFSPVVRVLDTCTSTTCSASSGGSTPGMPTVVNVDNLTALPRNVIVSVSGTDLAEGGTFDIVANATTVTNNVCATATPVMNGTTLSGENIGFATEALPGSCLPTATGRVLYYSLTVPVGQTLSAVATPSGFNVNMRLLSGCGSVTCVSNADASTGSFTAETLRFTNTTTAPVSYILAVGASSVTSAGTFSLAVTIAPPPYVESSTPTACDVMTGAPTVMFTSTSDDAATAISALPFSIPFFGTTATHYSVTTNGFAQLWTSMTGTPSTAAFNTATIPSTTTPNNYVAPFWDDLDFVTGTPSPSVVQVASFGTAPARHFTIQWTDWTHFSDGTARMTFQAQLYESGVIEYHYCTLTPGTSATNYATGAGATVGLENAAGTIGVRHETPNTAGQVNTTAALRYTPPTP